MEENKTRHPVDRPVAPGLHDNIQKESRLYKTALDHEMEALADKTKQIGKIAVIAGGAAFGSFLLINALRKKKKAPNDGKDKVLLQSAGDGKKVIVQKTKRKSAFMNVMEEQLALLIVGFLKAKISEYTDTEKKKIEKKKNEVANQ